MRKVDIRVKRTYQQLVDAMMKLLVEKDFENISVSDLCETAGVHRATFYKHFNDKFEFVNYCFKSQISTIDLNIFIKDPTPENVKKAILSFVKEVFNFADANMNLFSIICSEKYYAPLGSAFEVVLNDYSFKHFSDVLAAPKHKVEIMSAFYINALIGVVRWYVINGRNYPKEDIFMFIEHRTDELIEYYKNNLYDGSLS